MSIRSCFIAILCLIYPNIVFSVDYSFGFPTSQSGDNDWYISLGLGDTWQMNNGKWLRGHMGIDLVQNEYTNIFVSSNGTIDKVLRWPKCEIDEEVCDDIGRCRINKISNRGWGPTVVIKHEYEPRYTTDGTYLETTPAEDNPIVVYTQYGHLDSVEHLVEGQSVEKGEYLGQIGQICGWIPHLHFEIKDQAAIDYDRTYTSGAGFGYSGTDGHAPNRYIPQAFIEANQHLELPVEQPPQPNPQPQPSQTERTSLFSRVKNFFANIFTRAPADEVEGEVSSDQEQTQEEVVESENPAETDTTPTYDASLLATAPITIAPSDREVLVTIQARNTGNQDWLQSQVSLNVVGGRAANAPYRHSSWLTDLRPTRLDQSRVAPGDVGTFTTLIRVPEGSGDFTFRTQFVRQTGSQFVQLGSGFAAVDILIGDGSVVPEVAGEQVSSDVSDVPSGGITRQIRETIERVTREVGDTIGDAVEQLGETTRRIFFGGGGGSSSNNSTEAEASAVLDPPTILITAPTSSPYSATTSSIEMSGTMNDVVQSMSASTTASGTLSFSTTSLTWQWIGMLDAGTTTISISAASSEQTTSTELVVYYAPTYQLDAPVVVQPTTSSIWYTNATSTRISGTVDDRATQLRVASSSIAVVSSTWEYTPSTTEEGEYPYEFVARDVFENISSSTVFTVVYDITPPTIVTSSFELTSTTLAYTAVATDTLSGVAMYEWHVRSAGPGDIGTCTETTSTVALVDMSSTSSCQWGTLSRELASSTVALPDIVQSQDLVIRWRAIDRAGNSTDWEYHALAYELAQAEEEMPPVLITEIGWMGTVSSTADEWIEIMYTSSSIDIHHWWLVWGDYDAESGTYENEFEITVPGAPPDLPLALPLGYPILFERTDDTTVSNYMTPFIYTGALGNDGEYIALLDSERTIVDEIDARSGWFAGDNATKASMMRRSLVGDSNDPTVWCTYTDCSSDDPLWEVADKEDAGGNTILGTPGGPITGGPGGQL